MNPDLLFLPSTVIGSQDWNVIEQRENEIGPDALLSEILDKRLWSNAEIVWVLKRMIFYYGKKDSVLKKTPTDRLFTNLADVLRSFLMLLDAKDPLIDDNMRSYITAKLADSTWGINERTRDYLVKFQG